LQGGTLAAATTRPYTTAIPDDIKADIASVVHGVIEVVVLAATCSSSGPSTNASVMARPSKEMKKGPSGSAKLQAAVVGHDGHKLVALTLATRRQRE
jgi:hypothetical protein